MARALSHLMSKIRGSVGGLTYSANQFYQIIMKTRTSPVQPNTTLQTLMRGALNSASGTWLGLTQAVRDAWENYASNLHWPDPMGTHTIPGRQAFVGARGLQNFVFEAGYAVPTFETDAPPFFAGFLNPGSVSIQAPAGPAVTGIGVSVNADPVDDTTAFVEISPPMNPTRNRYKGPWDTTKTQVAIVPSGTSVLMDFVGYTDGDVLFVRVKCVSDDAPPRLSQEYILRGIAETVI